LRFNPEAEAETETEAAAGGLCMVLFNCSDDLFRRPEVPAPDFRDPAMSVDQSCGQYMRDGAAFSL